jgi:hypothetical protein
MGYLKTKPRKRKVVKLDVVSRTQELVRALKDTSLTDLEIANPKFSIRIKRSR